MMYVMAEILQCLMSSPLSAALGKRVSVRIRIDGGFQDFLGILEAPGSIRKKDGSLASFDESAVFAWREVQPITEVGKGLPLSLRISTIERAAFHTWLPATIEEFGPWIFRIDRGKTMRANSVLVLSEPPEDCEVAVKKVIETYFGVGLPPIIAVPDALADTTERYLVSHGWLVDLEVSVMIGDAEKIELLNNIDLLNNFVVEISEAPSNQWLALENDDDLLDIYHRSPAFYLAIKNKTEQANEIIARARFAIADGWGILSRIYVAENHRGQKLAQNLISMCAELARQQGVRQLALQVSRQNTAAVSLYSKLGFFHHHAFRYYKLNLSAPKDCC